MVRTSRPIEGHVQFTLKWESQSLDFSFETSVQLFTGWGGGIYIFNSRSIYSIQNIYIFDLNIHTNIDRYMYIYIYMKLILLGFLFFSLVSEFFTKLLYA